MKFKLADISQSNIIHIILAVIVIGITYASSMSGVSIDVIRADEQTTLGHIGSLGIYPDGITLIDTVNSLAKYSAQHPPLYFMSANIWGQLFTYDNYILRILSVFWGTLAIATFYRFASDVNNSTFAFYSSMLLAMSTVFWFYNHEIRQYSALMFWVVLIWLLYWRLSHKRTPIKRVQLLALISATACGMYTHYTVIFLLIPIGIYHILFVRKTKAWWQITLAMVTAGILYLPWVPTMISGFNHTVGEIAEDPEKLMTNMELLTKIIQFWGNGEELLFGVLVGLGSIGVIFNRRHNRYALFFFIGCLLSVFLLNSQLDFIKRIRYVIVLLVPFCLLGGFGLALINRWRILPLIFLVIWGVAGIRFQEDFDFRDQMQTFVIYSFIEYNNLIPIIRNKLSTDDLLVTVIDHRGVWKESKQDGMGIEDYYLSPLPIERINIMGKDSRHDFDLEATVSQVRDHSTFWLAYKGVQIPTLEDFLTETADTYQLCQKIQFGIDSTLEEYVVIDQFDILCIAN